MNDTEQRIAIAEACGINVTAIREANAQAYREELRQIVHPEWRRFGNAPLPTIPDYLNDLNAMHEAEKVLTHQQRKDYRWKLQQGYPSVTEAGQERLCHATARQRAEAFLRTVGKWRDEP